MNIHPQSRMCLFWKLGHSILAGDPERVSLYCSLLAYHVRGIWLIACTHALFAEAYTNHDKWQLYVSNVRNGKAFITSVENTIILAPRVAPGSMTMDFSVESLEQEAAHG